MKRNWLKALLKRWPETLQEAAEHIGTTRKRLYELTNGKQIPKHFGNYIRALDRIKTLEAEIFELRKNIEECER